MKNEKLEVRKALEAVLESERFVAGFAGAGANAWEHGWLPGALEVLEEERQALAEAIWRYLDRAARRRTSMRRHA